MLRFNLYNSLWAKEYSNKQMGQCLSSIEHAEQDGFPVNRSEEIKSIIDPTTGDYNPTTITLGGEHHDT